MELRKVFDTIPEQFDRYRPRYSPALFADLIACAGVGPGKSALELGPGTGQATDPILETGCDYHAIELGEHLCEMMKRKYGARENFDIVLGDFITHDFGSRRFDLVYSAATIQWIPEEIAFTKTFGLLKPGGTLAMLLTVTAAFAEDAGFEEFPIGEEQDVGPDGIIHIAVEHHLAIIHHHTSLTKVLNSPKIVTYKHDGAPISARHILHLAYCFFLELRIADCQNLINHKYFRFKESGHGKAEPDRHSA